MSSFLYGCWDLTSGPHACQVGISYHWAVSPAPENAKKYRKLLSFLCEQGNELAFFIPAVIAMG